VMLAGLQQVAWRRVDVSFLGARVKYQAHNTIQVCIHYYQWLSHPTGKISLKNLTFTGQRTFET